MKVFSTLRAGGKTYQAIKWVSEDKENRLLICATHQIRDYTIKMSDKKLDETNVKCWQDVITGRLLGLKQREVAIDNADLILQDYLRSLRLGFVTLTGEVFDGRNKE